ncbi:MAG: dihydrodipicolinate synthase family protein [Chloroflexota bacterium]|nr:dihydrodipicolinate synthase family protein [Anaerolineae bacterium]
MTSFHGVWPALLTPLTADDEIDILALHRLLDYVLGAGVHGIYVCGSTGEGVLLSVEERMHLAEATVSHVAGHVPVMVHVGAVSTRDAVALSHHARQIGASAVSSVPPFYYSVKPSGLMAHYRHISQAAQLPVYLYNLPNATGTNITARVMLELLALGYVQGLKYTSYNLLEMREIIEVCGDRLNIFSGPDEILLPCLVMGVQGGIGTTYNCLPHLFVELYDAWRNGDIARAQELQFVVDRVVLTLSSYSVIPAVKVAMRFLGLSCGGPRLPLHPLADEEEAQLRADLERAGFFDYARA